MRRRSVLRAAGVTGASALGVGLSGCTESTPGDDGSATADGGNDANGSGADGSGETGDGTDAYEPLGSVPLGGAAEAVVGDDGDTVYVAGVGGFATVDVSDPAAPTVLAEPIDLLADAEVDGRFRGILDVKVDGDRLAVVGPANPRSGNVFHGFLLYDVSDPADPVAATEPYETGYHIHNCYLADDLLYVVANDVETDLNALVTFDVSDDQVEEVGRWSLLDHAPEWADVDWILRYLHDVTVRGDLAALAYWNAGTCLLDVSDPAEPAFVSRVAETDLEEQLERSESQSRVRAAQMGLPGNDHYAEVDESAELLAIGREAWQSPQASADRPGGIDLYDVSDPEEPVHRAAIAAPRGTAETYDSEPWTTSHNFELRDGVLHSSWYQGGVKLHDVSDPAEPEELAWWRDPLETAFWTARVAEPGETFVASSSAYIPPSNRPENGLYTFPIEAGEQADPLPLDDPSVFEEDD